MSFTWRRLLFLLFMLLLTLPASIFAQDDLTETYVSADELVEFQYPAGWFVNDEVLAPGIVLGNSADVVELMGEPQTGDVVVILIPVITEYPYFPMIAPDASAMEATEALLEDLVGDLAEGDEFSVTGPTEVEIGPYSGVTAGAVDPGDEIEVFIVVMDSDTHLMAVVAMANTGDMAPFEATLVAVAETFVYSGEIMQPQEGTIAYGDSISTNLQVAGGDRWTFEGNAGDVVSIAMTSDFDNYLELYDTQNQRLASDDDSGGSLNALISDYILPADGSYTIVARGYSTTARGPYTLTLNTSETGGVIAVDNQIIYGDIYTAMLAQDGGDRWTFTGSAGDVVTIALDSDDFDTYLELLDASGTPLVSDDDGGEGFNSLISAYTLPADGSYIILARGFSSSARGEYVLTLSAAGASSTGGSQAVTGLMLSYGDVVTATLAQDGGDRWTFTGSAGDVVTIALDSDDFDTYLELLDANGAPLVSDDDGGEALNSLISGYRLSANGAYTIVARGFSSSARGAYTLSLNAAGTSGSGGTIGIGNQVAYGDVVTATLAQDDGDRWTFTGSAGDMVTIVLDSDDFDTYLELLDANGSLLVTDDDGGEGFNSLISGYALPASGAYTIVARGFSSSARGAYTLSLALGEAHVASIAGNLSYGEPVSAMLAQDGGDRWTFTGEAGELVSIAMNSDDFDTYLELYGPTDVQLITDDDGGDGLNSLIYAFVLPEDGQYTLVARGYSSSSYGAYTVQLSRFDASDLNEPGKVTYGFSGQALLSDSEGDHWTFSGNAGDVITIAMNSDSFDPYLELYGPADELLVSDDDSGGSLNALITGFILRDTGTYSIVARGYSTSGSGLYTLEVDTVDPALLESKGTLQPGVIVHGQLTALGDRWTYNAVAGDRISVLAGGDGLINLEILDAENTVIFDTADTYTSGYALLDDVELPTTGEYTIVIRNLYAIDWASEYALMLGDSASM